MRRLKVGDHAAFQSSSGQVVVGKVVADSGICYHVHSDDGRICHQYPDGMFRFTDNHVILESQVHKT